ncbi:acetyl-CoA synthetase-like protein [Athelia psychrophila]|uniref:Acetyl-CoA synthetase-like protein n=1 Tax=Athelia psychrophila TaxID=1759441 RepID=A0A166VTJ8_9AGAM|nr:acetyl-CoA synthetase-like protein [Fibularhizoctonia sp. CBS 109695]
MSSTPVYPPLDDSFTVSGLVDFNVEHNPRQPLFVYSEEPGSLTEISFLEFGHATHRAAHLVRPGRTGPEGEIVAVVANTDSLLYEAIFAGMIRAGVVPFPISSKNPAEALVSMLERSACHRVIITHASLGPLLRDVRELLPTDFPLAVEEIPTLSQCYPHLSNEVENDTFVPYPASQEGRSPDDLLFYLHSSGSTNFPKPIPQTDRTALSWCRADVVKDFRGSRAAVMHLPRFHTMSVIVQFLTTMTSVCSVALYPPTSFSDHAKAPVMPSPDNIKEHAKRTQSNYVIVPPIILELWSGQPGTVEWLKTLDFVGFGGGPLGLHVGNDLSAAGIPLRSIYGGTEFGGPLAICGTPEQSKAREIGDWNYITFSGGLGDNVRWVPQGDGQFECQFLDTDKWKVSVRNLPDVDGYATSDLWEPHPTKAGFWRIVGRRDDVLILSSGENVVPGPMEDIIISSEFIDGAVLFGRERPQVGVLVQALPGVVIGDLSDFRNKIWPKIEDANKIAPAFGRIFKEMILMASDDKPMPRAAKGTVTKKPTLKLYQSEIDALYKAVDASSQPATDVAPPKTWREADVQVWLGAQAADISSGAQVHAEVDLFEQGFDSLSATFLRNRINFIFSHPSIKQLASQIAALVSGGEHGVGAYSSAAAIESMIERHSAGLGEHVAASRTTLTEAVVLVTGSTGGLGSFLLESLLNDPRVKKVYAYNRPGKSSATIHTRQRDAFADKGFDVDLLTSHKLAYVEGDSALPQLGLSDILYAEIREQVTMVIHNTWRLDFNLSLASFDTNVRGTRNLIDIALYRSARFMFTSSIASAQGWDQGRGAFPEEVQTDVGVAVGGGYGEAKYASERILAKSGLQATSFRIGQMTGGLPNGAWSTTDWVPSLVKSSLALGALPDAHGVISWLPTQAVSQVILEVAFAAEAPSIALNVVHPKPVAWSTVMQPISEALHKANLTTKVLPLIPFKQWFEMLEQRERGADEKDMSRVPAIKLLEFFRGLSSADAAIRQSQGTDAEAGGSRSFSTVKSQAASDTMRDLAQIDAEDAERWVGYWSSVGFFT